MSTVPGRESWTDAGLVDTSRKDVVELEPDDTLEDTLAPEDSEEYDPDPPAPHVEGEADEADVADQRTELPDDEGEAYE